MPKGRANFGDSCWGRVSGSGLQVCETYEPRAMCVRSAINRTIRRIHLTRCPVGPPPTRADRHHSQTSRCELVDFHSDETGAFRGLSYHRPPDHPQIPLLKRWCDGSRTTFLRTREALGPYTVYWVGQWLSQNLCQWSSNTRDIPGRWSDTKSRKTGSVASLSLIHPGMHDPSTSSHSLS